MKKFLTFLMALSLILSLGAAALADGGNGDGSGGGKGEPLTLASCSVPNGSTGVATDVYITLTFSKNVVNFTVKDNNMGCFSMVDSKGTSVPISVIMGDDQVDPDCKRIVGIQPSGLKEGETYTLIIGGGVTSKSGVSLGSDIYISFTTLGAAAETAAPVESEAPEETEELPEEIEEAPITIAAPPASGEEDIAENEAAVESNPGTYKVVLASALYLVAAYFLTKEERK